MAEFYCIYYLVESKNSIIDAIWSTLPMDHLLACKIHVLTVATKVHRAIGRYYTIPKELVRLLSLS